MRTASLRPRLIAAALAAAAVPGLIAVVPAGTAAAVVCFGAGRRITVSGCTDFGAVAPYAPPPAYYAPPRVVYRPGPGHYWGDGHHRKHRKHHRRHGDWD